MFFVVLWKWYITKPLTHTSTTKIRIPYYINLNKKKKTVIIALLITHAQLHRRHVIIIIQCEKWDAFCHHLTLPSNKNEVLCVDSWYAVTTTHFKRFSLHSCKIANLLSKLSHSRATFLQCHLYNVINQSDILFSFFSVFSRDNCFIECMCQDLKKLTFYKWWMIWLHVKESLYGRLFFFYMECRI